MIKIISTWQEEELARLRAEIEREEGIQKQRHDIAYQRGKEAVQFNIENKKLKDAEQLITKVGCLQLTFEVEMHAYGMCIVVKKYVECLSIGVKYLLAVF